MARSVRPLTLSTSTGTDSKRRDPNAAISEPVKPIVYYVSQEVPDQWKEYVRKAIEDWQPAFEQAGFKNAIIAKIAPTKEEDPDWDPEDARYSVIRWAPSETENAQGPSVQDPRSGETISAHVIVWHNIVQLVENWYFSQCAAIDPKAQRLPIPDELMGRLIRYVVCHEVGHTLGLGAQLQGERRLHHGSASRSEVHRRARRCRLDHELQSLQLCGSARRRRHPDDRHPRSI